MTTVSVHQLKDSLSQVLASVAGGESVEVTRYGKPIAVITGVVGSGRPFNVDPNSVQEAITDPLVNDTLLVNDTSPR